MRIPVSTYRLQITRDFTLHDASAIVPYLSSLGISDVYLSPVFEARSSSTHGYDVTDPTRIRQAIGGLDALRALAAETRRHGMGVLIDIVPNHMAASVENPWWRDVLQHGRESRYAAFFDIDWGTAEAPKRLQLPILGGQPDELIESGEITLDIGANEIAYYETRLPIAPGSSDGTSDIRAVLAAQHYELAFWRDAATNMNYRRFFDITDLAGVRVEDDVVFQATHSLIRTLARDGTITGLRIDHIDGLRDPSAYLERLREFVRGPDGDAVYTVVEKILEHGEQLPADWQCDGTTGYEFLSIANGMLIEPDGHDRITRFYERIAGDRRSFDELVREKKLLVMERLFGAELSSLARAAADLSSRDQAAASRAIAALTASLDVYRTYISSRGISDIDRNRIEQAASRSIELNPDAAPHIEAIRALLIDDVGDATGEQLDFVMRWQQFTGPVMAKGFEDTALYCNNALVAANDVGTAPDRPWLTVEELHAALAERQSLLPRALNTTATHDTKRGEDTRARQAVISELPDEWRLHFRRWAREGEEWKAELTDDDTEEPGADVDSLLYQTLIGTWPVDASDESFLHRIQAYMTKAVREAKEQTSWRRPDEDFEEALDAFIERLMSDVGREGLIEDVASLAERVAPHGALNSLSQMLLRITAPGVPDTYQGTELWSLTLVDPDNREQVDYELRQRYLAELDPLLMNPDPAAIAEVLRAWTDGRIKLLLLAAALRFRSRHRRVFDEGRVVGLPAEGARADHVVAYARVLGNDACLTVVPRLTTRLVPSGRLPFDEAAWHDTILRIPAELSRPWHNALTGETHIESASIDLRALFATLPFALLDTSQPIGA